MPQEGNVQVANFSRLFTSGLFMSTAIEMGAKGEAVSLLQMSISMGQILGPPGLNLAAGLSSNPNHLLDPPISFGSLLLDPAIYGVMSVISDITVGGSHNLLVTQSLDLKGILRPRRQILAIGYGTAAAVMVVRVEILYRPVTMGKNDLDTLNRKYGLYRRGA